MNISLIVPNGQQAKSCNHIIIYDEWATEDQNLGLSSQWNWKEVIITCFKFKEERQYEKNHQHTPTYLCLKITVYSQNQYKRILVQAKWQESPPAALYHKEFGQINVCLIMFIFFFS